MFICNDNDKCFVFWKRDIKWIFEIIFDEKQSYRDGVAKKSLVKIVKYSQGVLIRKLN